MRSVTQHETLSSRKGVWKNNFFESPLLCGISIATPPHFLSHSKEVGLGAHSERLGVRDLKCAIPSIPCGFVNQIVNSFNYGTQKKRHSDA